jgi:hypothetical protein
MMAGVEWKCLIRVGKDCRGLEVRSNVRGSMVKDRNSKEGPFIHGALDAGAGHAGLQFEEELHFDVTSIARIECKW